MRNYIFILLTGFLFFSGKICAAQDTISGITDTLTFSGQLSAWGHYNHQSALPVIIGGRYIPSLNYCLKFPHGKLIDFEGSANIFGYLAQHPFDTSHTEGSITPYRTRVRFSTNQLEVRLGLQKINFGSSTLLRPLMWFDQLDPRDPLKLTNGVWAILGRYYFMNNANIWLWCLYGNNKQRPWDIGKTTKNTPELGTRLQVPVRKGEVAISYHFRKADTRDIGNNVPAFAEIPESRWGIDGKWDLGVGVWFEGVWIHKNKNLGALTNQEIINAGIDYTFNLGNGLNAMFEQMLVASDEYAFEFENCLTLSALSISYPLGIVDYLNAIVYYDWKNRAAYNFINWNHNFKYVALHTMAYWNPDNYQLPQQGNSTSDYAGPGFQIMLVYNH